MPARCLQELANPAVLTSLRVSHLEWAGLPGACSQWVAAVGMEEEEQDGVAGSQQAASETVGFASGRFPLGG